MKAKETTTTDRTSLSEKKSDDDSAEEDSEEDEEYLPVPHLTAHPRAIITPLPQFYRVFAPWKLLSRFNASVALEMYFVVYVLLRFGLPVVVELARMGWRRAKKTILFSGWTRKSMKKKKKELGGKDKAFEEKSIIALRY